jgi:AbrB family looped-hinge helix DNA binding protein
MEMVTQRRPEVHGPVLRGVILVGMTYKVGPKGQVVIPKPIRDRLGISPGDEVVVEQDGGEVRIRLQADDVEARRRRIRALRGSWAGVPGFSTADLEADHREEREREERKMREYEELRTRRPR